MSPSVVDIQIAVARRFQVSALDMLIRDRSHRVLIPRQLAYWLAWKTGKSTAHIGRKFDRDHATIMHGVKAIDQRMKADPDLAATARDMLAEFLPPKMPVWRAAPSVTYSGRSNMPIAAPETARTEAAG